MNDLLCNVNSLSLVQHANAILNETPFEEFILSIRPAERHTYHKAASSFWFYVIFPQVENE